MAYDPLLSRSDIFHHELFGAHRQFPIDSTTLGDAYNLYRGKEKNFSGKISEESFKKIRDFRARMAEWDRLYSHWAGREELTKGAPANDQR